MYHIADIRAFQQRERTLLVKGADPLTEQGWTAIPNRVLRDRGLSTGAKLTYTMMLYYAREDQACFPGQDRLAADIGSGKRSVVRYVAELEKAGILHVKRRGQGRPNVYTLRIKASYWNKPTR